LAHFIWPAATQDFKASSVSAAQLTIYIYISSIVEKRIQLTSTAHSTEVQIINSDHLLWLISTDK